MNKVNLGDKYSHRLTVRLNEEQFQFLIDASAILGVSPSDYIRMAVNSGMVMTKEQKKGTVGTNENVKANSDNIV